MKEPFRWFDRKFAFKPPPELFPVIVERLRGTTARAEEKAKTVPAEMITRRLGDSWSIQENIGHLLDVEELWEGRIDDFLSGEKELRPADLSNRSTHQADHNSQSLDTLVSSFRARRSSWVARLDDMTDEQVIVEALHPRLGQPMRVIDLCFFVAEHDDHHLARMSEIWRALRLNAG